MYCIYIIELSKNAFRENRRFREANPQYNGVSECLYVGMTSKTPEKRWEQHRKISKSKKGHALASSIVSNYGLYLRPSLYRDIPTVRSKKEALKVEAEVTRLLRRQRYAVWSN